MESIKKDKKPFAVKPSLYAACVELAGRRPAAGGLLCQIARYPQDKGLQDEHGIKGWLALTSDQWRCLTGFTRHQYNDALSYLKKMELIQFRRRKISYKNPAAVAWLRLSDSAKAGIAEIMARSAIAAFTEITFPPISDKAEIIALTTSVKAEPLILNDTTLTEITSENVIITETKIIEDTSIQEEENKQENSSKKKTNNKAGYKKSWFNTIIQEIYKNSNFSPEPYSEQAAKIIETAKEYLEGNPGGYLDYCPIDSPSYSYALNQAITNWSQFSWFSQLAFNGFNIPVTPQLWSLKHQLKAVPDFIKFQNYVETVRARFAAEGITLNVKSSLNEQDGFKQYYYQFLDFIHLPTHQKQDFVTHIMQKSSEYKKHKYSGTNTKW